MTGRESLRGRLGRFVALVGVVFAITAGVVVTQRLSADALALLLGLACGVGALLPTLVLGWAVWQRQERQWERRTASVNPAQPPVIVVTAAPALPGGSGAERAAGSPEHAPWAVRQPRQFAIVGEEE